MFQNFPLFDQITRTKIILPRRRADLLSRQRLVDDFHELLDYRLIIITAPAGYGKTSLLVDVAHQIELPVYWYAIDPLDQDPQRFIAHFIAAIAHGCPGFGQQSAAVLESTTLETSDLDRLVRVLVNEAYEHLQEHFIFVLDDFHFINNKKILYFVNQFAQVVDENCHLVISSRSLLALPDLVLMVGRTQVTGLGLNDLAFQADEIQALILQNYNVSIAQTMAEELAQETEGWITGLLLSAHTMWQGMADRLRLARISGVDMYDYLAQQVLEQQSPIVQDFLLRTALLEEFDADLCLAVLGPAEYPNGENWSDLMDTIVRNNLFVVPVDDKETWLRYHHLFQDFLQGQMEAERPDEKADILRRLAIVYSERNAWEKAHDLYHRLGNTQAIANLIEQAGLSLVNSGRFMTLGTWIDTLSDEILFSRPFLLTLRGYAAVMLGEVKQGLKKLNQAEAAFRMTDDVPDLIRTLVWRAGVKRLLGEYRASLDDVDGALALAETEKSMSTLQADALRVKGVSLDAAGRSHEAIACYKQSLDIFKTLYDPEMMARLYLDLGLAHMRVGHYGQALVHYNYALDHWQKTGNIVRQANLLNNLGVLYHLKGDYEQAVAILEKALICAQQSGHTRMEAFILCGIGDIYADLGALDTGRTIYHQTRTIAQYLDHRFLLFYLDLAEAALARLQGDLAQAQALLDSAGQLAQEKNSSYEQGLYHLEAGRLALTEARGPEAVAYLKEGAHLFDESGQQVEAACAYLDLARAYQMIEDRQRALEHLGYTFRFVSNLENQHLLVAAGREAMPLLKMVRSDKRLGSQVTRLLKQMVDFEQNIPFLRRKLRRQTSLVPFAPPKLAVCVLGKTEVKLDGKLVTTSEWQTQRRVREFFFHLLAHPDGLTREAIGAIFWPDSSASQLKLQFKNTIYRLRRALDKEAIIYDVDKDRYYFNRQLDYEYDVEMFHKAMNQAQAAKTRRQQAAAYEAAIDLYQGSYLSEIDGVWVWPERERLAQAYLEANLKLAEFHLETDNYEVALEYCHVALTEDPCLEQAHRQAMEIYARLGNRAAVIRQFEQCQQALLTELDVPVSPQTKHLYERLIR